jgi:hypothetical protein
MEEDHLGDALANIRQAMRNAKTDEEIDALEKQREKMTERLNTFVAMHLEAIDKDPEIKRIKDALGQLTLATQKAVKEMQTVKKTIDQATTVLKFADQFIAIVGKLAGVIR